MDNHSKMVHDAAYHPEEGTVIEYSYQGKKGTIVVNKVHNDRVDFTDSFHGHMPEESVFYVGGGWTILIKKVLVIKGIKLPRPSWEV